MEVQPISINGLILCNRIGSGWALDPHGLIGWVPGGQSPQGARCQSSLQTGGQKPRDFEAIWAPQMGVETERKQPRDMAYTLDSRTFSSSTWRCQWLPGRRAEKADLHAIFSVHRPAVWGMGLNSELGNSSQQEAVAAPGTPVGDSGTEGTHRARLALEADEQQNLGHKHREGQVGVNVVALVADGADRAAADRQG